MSQDGTIRALHTKKKVVQGTNDHAYAPTIVFHASVFLDNCALNQCHVLLQHLSMFVFAAATDLFLHKETSAMLK